MGVFDIKKILKIILRCMPIFILVTMVIFMLWDKGAFISDRSADVSSNHVIWNGREYSPVSGEYTEGRTIAKGKDGDWVINSVKEDSTHTFIVARSFLDQYLMVADDYIVPTEGKVTAASWNGKYIYDSSFLDIISKIESEKVSSFIYQTENLNCVTENQHMRSLYLAYDNCPIASDFKGYMGKINGEWVITVTLPQEIENDAGLPKNYSVNCYKIPDEYSDIISGYFS